MYVRISVLDRIFILVKSKNEGSQKISCWNKKLGFYQG